MSRFRNITVRNEVPEELKELKDFSYNLWWGWQPKALELFRQLAVDLWHEVEHNPLKLLKQISQSELNAKSSDPAFLSLFHEVMKDFNHYMTRENTWFNEQYGNKKNFRVAYFSAEFGVHESVPVYSGGLGILAGDHCKSASDLGVPLVGVGMMYKQGYFIQRINADGNQENIFPTYDFEEIPVTLVRNKEKKPVMISVIFPGRRIYAQIWKMQAGRTSIYLLDTDIPENLPEDRIVTSQLYGGDQNMRITQEILLGIGGIRALRELGIAASIYHMNEGHSAFLALELIREKLLAGFPVDVAIELVSSQCVFTTHTPVPAGNDAFSEEMMHHYFGAQLEPYGIPWQQFFEIGKDPGTGLFSMTVLALNCSKTSNGVSELHGEVSRKIWGDIWKDIPDYEVPITHITNGVHTETWMAKDFKKLYANYLDPSWKDRLDEPELWAQVDNIPSRLLWETHYNRKARLAEVIKDRIRKRNERNGVPAHISDRIASHINPDALFIGFARRFATYKRATLLFQDEERLNRLLNDKDKPLVIFFAGKAHPADRPGQELIRQIYALSMKDAYLGKIVLLENYNMSLARYLVSGVDIWLNNPRRPREASGTSGQKVPINGGINFSVLDGWWRESYNGRNGWPIGEEKDYDQTDIQDREDANSLYYTLENAILPEFFETTDEGYSPSWVKRMKESIKSVVPAFSTSRMVKDYVNKCYIPTDDYYRCLYANDQKSARELAAWKKHLREAWPKVWITEINPVGDFTNELSITLNADINLDGINPDEVMVEALLVRQGFEKQPPIVVTQLQPLKGNGGRYPYRGELQIPKGGNYKYGIRVRPVNKLLKNPFETRLIRWMEF
ncbi:MAG: alpha-glucan family phosphorylase [Candidatus Neomarinimicrobiota bacterium]|jgi:starch phosphorylase|nr:alpha-glucan family phosphorylase [Candidatus Neomarinimicrobiota bacterium]MDX9780703.1 alpha-glucan family phosphorylase [bacterium]